MSTVRTPHNSQWIIVTFKEPVMFTRSDDETWMFNPRRRHILNANVIGPLTPYVEKISDLKNSAHFRPLRSGPGIRLPGSHILIERYRERGVGDLLFTTGPIAYLHHITGGDINVHMYALAERGAILNHHPALSLKSTLAGPVYYDDLPLYDFHWFIDTVTEYDDEADQLNVYDALYKQIGVDPQIVDAKFKRPTAALSAEDIKNLDQFFYWAFTQHKLDLRRSGYFVVAPFSNSSLRSMPYSTWLEIIRELANRRPVIVVGAVRERMPATDMSAGDFQESLGRVPGGQIINALGHTPLRLLMALISKAKCVASLDSGALYIAQAFRTPCVSIWGPHHPGVRIGYDREYMELAVWESKSCRFAPCFAYAGFPSNKCPRGEHQSVCEVLGGTDPNRIVALFDSVEARQQRDLGSFKSATGKAIV